MVVKPCIKCSTVKPLCEFYPHKKMRDGHLNMCMSCGRAAAIKWRNENLDRVREQDRLRANLPHRVAGRIKSGAEWRRLNPTRRRAQVLLGNAVRRGEIAPQPCFVCGMEAEAHHPDYDRPLDVVWLCTPHHRQAHALVSRL